MVNNPGFFKFYIPSLGEENMKIPIRFSQSIQGTWPANLTLRDCYNNLWQVKVELVGGTWYFKDGWAEFAVDNILQGGDMLVYEYSSHGLLDFKVHGRSACLTKGVGGHRTKSYFEGEPVIDVVDCSDDSDDFSPTTKEENDQDDYFEGVKVIDVPNATDEDECDLTTDEENQPDDCLGVDEVIDVTYDSEENDSFPTTEEGDQREDYEVMDDDTEDDDYLPTITKETQQEADPSGMEAMNVHDHNINCKREPTTEDVNQERTQEEVRRDDSIPGVQVKDDGGPSTSKRKSTRDFDWYGVEIFQPGLVHQPNNPYFVTKIRKLRAYELYMPMDVIKNYGLELPNTILLIDPRRREFRATRKMWSDGRTFYTGGWRSLCGMNQVKDDDSCICEFLQRGQDLCIHVSFFPPRKSNNSRTGNRKEALCIYVLFVCGYLNGF